MAKEQKERAKQWKNMAKKWKDNRSPINDSLFLFQADFWYFSKTKRPSLFFSLFVTFCVLFKKVKNLKQNENKQKKPLPRKKDIKET